MDARLQSVLDRLESIRTAATNELAGFGFWSFEEAMASFRKKPVGRGSLNQILSAGATLAHVENAIACIHENDLPAALDSATYALTASFIMTNGRGQLKSKKAGGESRGKRQSEEAARIWKPWQDQYEQLLAEGRKRADALTIIDRRMTKANFVVRYRGEEVHPSKRALRDHLPAKKLGTQL